MNHAFWGTPIFGNPQEMVATWRFKFAWLFDEPALQDFVAWLEFVRSWNVGWNLPGIRCVFVN